MGSMEIANYATIVIALVSIIGSIVSIGVVFGVVKGKLRELDISLHNSKELNTINNNSVQRQIDSVANEITYFKENARLLEHYVEEKDDNVRTYINSELKIVNRDVQGIKSNCYGRKVNVEMVPSLAEKVKQLEIEIGVLPSKLSEELSKAFSEEYKKLVKTISDNTNK